MVLFDPPLSGVADGRGGNTHDGNPVAKVNRTQECGCPSRKIGGPEYPQGEHFNLGFGKPTQCMV